MKEELVSIETAKLLKELGFDWKCKSLYNHKGELSGTKMGMKGNPNNYVDYYSAPTQSLAQKWLRDIKGIDIRFNVSVGRIYHLDDILIVDYEHPGGWTKRAKFIAEHFETYEQALEAGLLASLNYLKQTKQK